MSVFQPGLKGRFWKPRKINLPPQKYSKADELQLVAKVQEVTPVTSSYIVIVYLSAYLPTCLPACLSTYLPACTTHLPTVLIPEEGVRVEIHMIFSFLPTCQPACLHAFLPAYLSACLICLPTYLPACLPSYLPACVPVCLSDCLPVCCLPTCLN